MDPQGDGVGITLRLPGEPGKVTEVMPKDLDVADVGGWGGRTVGGGVRNSGYLEISASSFLLVENHHWGNKVEHIGD